MQTIEIIIKDGVFNEYDGFGFILGILISIKYYNRDKFLINFKFCCENKSINSLLQLLNFKDNNKIISKSIVFNKRRDIFKYHNYLRKMYKKIHIYDYIEIKDHIKSEIQYLYHKINSQNTIGLLLRGSDLKFYHKGHCIPRNIIDECVLIDKVLKDGKFDSILLATDDRDYLNYLEKRYSSLKIYNFQKYYIETDVVKDYMYNNLCYQNDFFDLKMKEYFISLILLSKLDTVYINIPTNGYRTLVMLNNKLKIISNDYKRYI